jgi:hypothetical protein
VFTSDVGHRVPGLRSGGSNGHFEAATSIAAITDGVREAGFYGHEQQVPAEATPLARLAAFSGRTVSTAER